MAGSIQWQGSASFAGMPIPMAFYSAIESEKSVLKMLDPTHKQPVSQAWQAVDGTIIERDETLRGVEYGAGWVEVDLDLAGKRSELLGLRFHSESDVPLEFTKSVYYVGPSNAPGSGGALNGLWNLLRAKKLVASMGEWVQKSNSRPWTVVLRATEDALMAHALVYAASVRENDVFTPVKDAKVAKNMATVMEMQHKVEPLAWESIADTYSQRRDAAIEAALAGKPLPEVPEAPALAPVNDLIAQVEAMAAQAKPKPKPRKKVAA